MIKKVFLHWTATDYNWCQPGHYHYVITGDGEIHKLHEHEELLPHTYKRNTDAISVAIACMGGSGFSEYPPTGKQINSAVKLCNNLCKEFNWNSPDGKFVTHAEAAALRDYPLEIVKKYGNSGEAIAISAGLPHDNYGPQAWHDEWPGGTAERWDLWQLKQSDKGGIGGFILRGKIKDLLNNSSEKQDSKSDEVRIKVKAIIKKLCEEYKLDYNLILAQLIIESNLNPDAISTSRALGVGQIKLSTAQEVAKRNKLKVPEKEIDLLGIENAEYNIRLMCCFINELINKAKQNPIYSAWIMYNSGPSSFEMGKVNIESCNYVNKIAKKIKEMAVIFNKN